MTKEASAPDLEQQVEPGEGDHRRGENVEAEQHPKRAGPFVPFDLAAPDRHPPAREPAPHRPRDPRQDHDQAQQADDQFFSAATVHGGVSLIESLSNSLAAFYITHFCLEFANALVTRRFH